MVSAAPVAAPAAQGRTCPARRSAVLLDRRARDCDASSHGIGRPTPPGCIMGYATMAERSLLRSTVRALLAPRRLVPIVVVGGTLVVAQARFSVDPLAVPLGVAMCAVFFFLAPVSWRALFPPEAGPRTFAAPFGRLVVYAIMGASTVLMVGSFLPSVLGMRPTFLTSDVSLLVSTALFWVGGYGLGRDIDMETRLEHAEARAHVMSMEAERAQLLALRSHLDPHFLFNTLNAIAEWCREDGLTAERATLELSAMLRTVMDATHRSSWPLSEELELQRMLLDLHRIRDPEVLQLESRIAVPLPAVEVPPMLLLPLVENAIKHGPASGHGGVIRRCLTLEDDSVVFEIENPGAYLGPRDGGHGLDLVRRRLEHAYAGRATFEIDGVGDRTLARVVIPLRMPLVNT
jgi:two-component system, LytTR family, sensor histidine kinase AlgZ